MKCIIAGSRSFAPQRGDSLDICGLKLDLIDKYVDTAVRLSGFKISCVVSGKARGIDSGGERWAKRNGIPIYHCPARWRINGHYDGQAGHKRNVQMSKVGDCAVIVWDGNSSGTADTIDIMREENKPVYVYIPSLTLELAQEIRQIETGSRSE